jgi:hypothetical protein
MRVTFRVEKTLTSDANKAEIQVFNLDPKRLKLATAQVQNLGRYPIGISTGYDRSVGVLFTGQVRKMEAGKWVGQDRISVFTCDDGGEAIEETVMPPLSVPASTARAMVTAALGAFALYKQITIIPHSSVEETYAASGPLADMPFTLAHVGKASDLLTQAARRLGARWWIDNGQLYMAKLGLPTDRTGLRLGKDVLLADPEELGNGFHKFVTFCDPNIAPGMQMFVDPPMRAGVPTATGPGIYRVSKCIHTGDTHGSSPWACEIIALESAL